MAWYHRLFNLARSEQHTRDLDREIAHHLAERKEALMNDGMNEAAAEKQARRQFGNTTEKKEQTRDVDVLTWLDSMFTDIRYAVRALGRSPGFAIVAILSLALGIGANTAIFSLLDAVMLKSLPVSHPEQLVAVTMGKGDNEFTNPLWEQIREHQDMFAGAFATTDSKFDLTTGGQVRRAKGEYVSGDYFNVLGVRPAAGRLIVHADDVRGCRAIAVLSSAFFMSEFNADPAAIGKSIELNGRKFEIIGVTDPAYFGMTVGSATQVYAPLCSEAVIAGSDADLDQRQRWWLTITARVRPEVSASQLTSRLKAISAPIYLATTPSNWAVNEQTEYQKGVLQFEAQPGGLSDLRSAYKTALFTLMVVVGVVLLIACGNVANLLLARARVRQREAAVRLAVGAGRGRLIRQLLTESLVLSAVGTAAGVLLAIWGTRVLVSLLSTNRNTVWLDLTLDGRVLAFTSAIAVLTGLLFGIVPAWRSANVDPQDAMRGSGRGIAGERSRFSLVKTLVVGQVALSLVLLVAAGLLLGSFQRQTSIDLGFRGEGVLVVNADIRRVGLAAGARGDYYRAILERLRQVPGARSASSVDIVPLGNARWNQDIIVQGFESKNKRDNIIWFNEIGAHYFETIGTPMTAGRDLSAADTPNAPRVAIVNESMAKKFFPGKAAVGQFFQLTEAGKPADMVQIVGVVKDSKYSSVREDHSETAFLAASQDSAPRPSTGFVIRATGSPAAIIPEVKSALNGISGLIAYDFTTLDGIVATSLARPRLLARLSIFFGALALTLSIIGLYGTMSYSVERRRNEIGIRIALGAARTRVLSMVLREAGWMVAGGIVLGVAIAVGATRWVATLLYGVTPTDVPTFAIAGAALAVVALAASAIPAWRAARLDPMKALREE